MNYRYVKKIIIRLSVFSLIISSLSYTAHAQIKGLRQIPTELAVSLTSMLQQSPTSLESVRPADYSNSGATASPTPTTPNGARELSSGGSSLRMRTTKPKPKPKCLYHTIYDEKNACERAGCLWYTNAPKVECVSFNGEMMATEYKRSCRNASIKNCSKTGVNRRVECSFREAGDRVCLRVPPNPFVASPAVLACGAMFTQSAEGVFIENGAVPYSGNVQAWADVSCDSDMGKILGCYWGPSSSLCLGVGTDNLSTSCAPFNEDEVGCNNAREVYTCSVKEVRREGCALDTTRPKGW